MKATGIVRRIDDLRRIVFLFMFLIPPKKDGPKAVFSIDC